VNGSLLLSEKGSGFRERQGSPVAARLQFVLNELRLPTVKRLWAVLAEQSNKEGWPAERFLVTVMEHELAERDTRRLESIGWNPVAPRQTALEL